MSTHFSKDDKFWRDTKHSYKQPHSSDPVSVTLKATCSKALTKWFVGPPGPSCFHQEHREIGSRYLAFGSAIRGFNCLLNSPAQGQLALTRIHLPLFAKLCCRKAKQRTNMLSIFWRPLRHWDILLPLLARSWDDTSLLRFLLKDHHILYLLAKVTVGYETFELRYTVWSVVSYWEDVNCLEVLPGYLPAVHGRQLLRHMPEVILRCQTGTGVQKAGSVLQIYQVWHSVYYIDNNYWFRNSDKFETKPLSVLFLNWSVSWSCVGWVAPAASVSSALHLPFSSSCPSDVLRWSSQFWYQHLLSFLAWSSRFLYLLLKLLKWKLSFLMNLNVTSFLIL